MTDSQLKLEDNQYRIGYQCMVDSFAISVDSIEQKRHLYPDSVYGRPVTLLPWDQEYDEYCFGAAFYGGDLPGITKAVKQYLADLGIGLLYLTPIFEAKSNHKYDTLDYTQIDPQFGTMDDFNTLLQTCHHHDIKVILDGVFNHTSRDHIWFEHARDGKEPYTEYYQKNKEGYYLNWAGVDTLPLLNHDHPDVQHGLYADDNSVVPWWLAQGADGWRLDVAEGLGLDVIEKIKAIMNRRFPDKLLFGEVVDSYGKKWLGPHTLDGVMNYVFLGTTVNFLSGKIDGLTYLNELDRMATEYPEEQLRLCWNIISSHDTNRLLYEVDGNENLFKMAVTLQFTYPGMPMIYYGDEVGIVPRQKDKDNRLGMDWDTVDLLRVKARERWKHTVPMDWRRINQYSSIHFYYQHLIWLKRTHPVLTEGSFVPVYSDESTIAYARRLGSHVALVILNKGNSKQIRMKKPKAIDDLHPILKGVHGPIPEIDWRQDILPLKLETENTYIFIY